MSRFILSTLALLATGSNAYAKVTVSSAPFWLSETVVTKNFIDFDNPMPAGFTLTGGRIQNVTNAMGAEPARDKSNYLATTPGDPATLKSTKGFENVSFYWGSGDTYNTVTLLDEKGNAIQSYTGSQVFFPANGNRIGASTNRRVDFTTSGSTSPIYGLEFQSSAPAFEVDNIAFMTPSPPAGGVPEPTTWTMIISGMGLVGAGLRHKKNVGSLLAPT